MVDTNGMYVIFQSRWMQHTFKHDTLLFKFINWENKINHLSNYPWCNTPDCLVSLPSFIKHIYYLPNGGNIAGVFKFNILEDVVSKRCVWWFGVEMFAMLSFFLSYRTVYRHFLWFLHHSGCYFGNKKHNCFDFCL